MSSPYVPRLLRYYSPGCCCSLRRSVRRSHSPTLVRDFYKSETRRSMASMTTSQGDLNNTAAARPSTVIAPDLTDLKRTLAIPVSEDDALVRKAYRPFLLDDEVTKNDWVSELELSTVLKMVEGELKRSSGDRLKVLVLFGSMRRRWFSPLPLRLYRRIHRGFDTIAPPCSLPRLAIRSYSRLLALEAARILFRLGCDVRVYDPMGLPVKDDEQHSHEKVQELRQLSRWSDGHIWVSPEQHGNIVSHLFCVNLTQAVCPIWFVASILTSPRLLSSKTKSTGSLSQPARFDQHKAGRWQLLKCRAVLSLSILSIPCEYSGVGCACLLYPIRAQYPKHTHNSRMRLPTQLWKKTLKAAAGSYQVVIEIDSWTVWRNS